MTVDLLSGLADGIEAHNCGRGCGGIVTFRNGARYYSLCVGPDKDGEIEVRIEHGVYRGYTRDGRPCNLVDKHWVAPPPGTPERGTDIVEFIRCERNDPRAAGLETQTTP